MTFSFFLLGVIFLWIAGPTTSASCEDHGPTKIFLLAGQSNMVGMASIEHMRKLLDNTTTREEFLPYWDEAKQAWAERHDVYCKFDDNLGRLKVGFGAPGRGGHFGPELGFGWVVGDSSKSTSNCDSPIFLLKTAYGGRDLAIDFRPPRSGEGDYDGVHPAHYGWQYRLMISDTLAALANLTNLVPGYDEDVGYKLEGFVWFQGWNDMVDASYKKVNEYEFNLANLIRDVREDLDAPGMPFLVGGMGQLGVNATGRGSDRYYAMQNAEKAVTLFDEFRNNTLYVPTGHFMNYPGNDTYNGGYHYDGRADVYTHIGRAFGNGMLQLMGIQPYRPRGNEPRQPHLHLHVHSTETRKRKTVLRGTDTRIPLDCL